MTAAEKSCIVDKNAGSEGACHAGRRAYDVAAVRLLWRAAHRETAAAVQDYSLSEIAAAAGISRQGVHDTLARAEELLEGYERTLGCIARDARLQKQLEVIAQNAQALARIPAAAPQAGAILRAVQEIKE